MTEHEKMLAGAVYDPFAENMPGERSRAHRLCLAYNALPETAEAEREAVLRQLLPHRGQNVYLQGPIYIDFGANLTIGDGSYANFCFTAATCLLALTFRCSPPFTPCAFKTATPF